MRMKQQDAISYPGQIPIRIFTDQLVVIAFEQSLGALEDHVKFAIEYLSETQFWFDECRKAWGESFMEERAQEICAENVAAINGNITAALHPIERAYWNLNALCDVDINPSTFSTFKRRTKRGGEGKVEMKQIKPKAAATKRNSSVAKRELVTLGVILLGVIGCFASGGIVAMAMNGQKKKDSTVLSHVPFKRGAAILKI